MEVHIKKVYRGEEDHYHQRHQQLIEEQAHAEANAMSMYSRDDVGVKDISRSKTIVESIEDHIERSIAEIEAGYSNE